MDPARHPGRRRRSALTARLRRALRPPRRLRPTRAGWLFFFLVFAVGFAALNTGNNLLYLVLSLMLAFLVLSGVLSEAALRGIQVERRLPFEWVAGRAGRVVLEVTNAQRRTWSHAIVVEDVGAQRDAPAAPLGRVFAMRIAPGQSEARSYRYEPAVRGELGFHGFRVTTRFPFGLFAKSRRPATSALRAPRPPTSRTERGSPPRRRGGRCATRRG